MIHPAKLSWITGRRLYKRKSYKKSRWRKSEERQYNMIVQRNLRLYEEEEERKAIKESAVSNDIF